MRPGTLREIAGVARFQACRLSKQLFFLSFFEIRGFFA
jgi:hypothetical protein